MSTKKPPTKILLPLLATAMACDFLFLFFFVKLDYLVHTDLYRYGLQFSYAWANPYWSYSTWIMILQLTAIIAAAVSIILILIDAKSLRTRFRSSCVTLLTLGVVLNLSNVFLFLQIDNIVNQDLYNFGLQFSTEWANIYWIYAKLIVALPIVASVSMALSILFISHSHKNTRIATSKVPSVGMLAIGTFTLLLSIYATSSLLAFIGLGLVFWGAILAYVRSGEYVKKALLIASLPPSITDRAIRESGFKGTVIYLPPKYFRDPRHTKIFIAREEGILFPQLEQVQEREELPLSEIQDGIVMDALGQPLCMLFENTLRQDFTKVDLTYLERNLPKLLIEELEAATAMDIHADADRIKVRLRNSVFHFSRQVERKTSIPSSGFSSIVASAIACSLARGTGKAVVVESEEADDTGKTVLIEYRLLSEPAGQGHTL